MKRQPHKFWFKHGRLVVTPFFLMPLVVGLSWLSSPAMAETCQRAFGARAGSLVEVKDAKSNYTNPVNTTISTRDCAIAFEWWKNDPSKSAPHVFINAGLISLVGTRLAPGDNRTVSFVDTVLDVFTNTGTITTERMPGTLTMTIYNGRVGTFTNAGTFGNPNLGFGLYLSGAAGARVDKLVNTGIFHTNGSAIIINRGSINEIDNSGTMASSSAPVFQLIRPQSGPMVITNSGIIASGTDLDSVDNIFSGSGSTPIATSIRFTNMAGGVVRGSLNFGSGNDVVTLHGGSTVTGNISGGSGTNTITLRGTDPGVHSRNITGFSTLTKVDNNIWTLEGTVSVTNLSVESGSLVATGPLSSDLVSISNVAALQIGDGVTNGLFTAGTVNNNGMLSFNNASDTVFSTPISGSGDFRKQGAGILSLSASNTYRGTTTIASGTLATRGVDVLPSTTNLLIGSKGRLSLGGNQTVARLEGLPGGELDIRKFQFTANVTQDSVFAGNVLGDGGRLVVNGSAGKKLTLRGDSQFNGKAIVRGGTLALDSLNALGIYAVVELDGGTLEVDQDTILGAVIGDARFANNVPDIVTIGGAQVKTLLTITLADRIDGVVADVEFLGRTYAAGLIKISDGTPNHGVSEILKVERYTGITAVRAGRLRLVGEGELASKGSLVMYETGVFELNANKDQTFASIAGAGGVIELGARTLTVNGDADTKYGGVLTGAGAFVKEGSGTLTLTSGNDYTGGTTIAGGVLAVGHERALGTGGLTFKNNAVLATAVDFAVDAAVELVGAGTVHTQDNTVAINGPISGGALNKAGEGVLVLSGANTYSGGTVVRAGTLALASDTAAGTGQIVMADDTTLQASASISVANDVDLKGAVVIDTQNFDMSLGGSLTNAAGGQIIKQGGGTLALLGANSYTGGTEVRAGTLVLGSNTAAGTGDIVMQTDTTLQAASDLTLANIIDLKGAVTFDTQSFNLTLNSAVTNATGGQLIKTGSGTLTLNGTNTYTGGTLIGEGTLALYGTLASFVTVGSGTVFGGGGTVNGDVTNAGLIQPRLNGARSTLTVVGNFVGQDGVFATTLGGTTEAIEADRLAIQGMGHTASGTTTITVSDPTGVLGRPTVGDGILLVDVSSGATSARAAFNAPRIASGAYEYTLVRGGQGSAESWYLRADSDGPPPPVIVTPRVAQREEVALYSSLPSLTRQYLWSVNGTLDDRRGAPDALDQWQSRPIAWGRVIGQETQSRPGNANNGPGLKTNEWALQLGVDLWRANSGWGQWRVGPVLTIGRSKGSAYSANGAVRTGGVGLDAHSLGLNATVASQSGGYADLFVLATRLTGVQANSPLGTSIATTGWAYSGSLEGGWRVPMTSNFAITPQAQIYNATVNLNSAADAFSLIKMPSNSSWLGRLGIKLSYDQVDAQGLQFQFWARASVFSTLAGQDASTSFLNLVGTNPTTFQSRAPSTWTAFDAAMNIQTTTNTSVQISLGYQTSFDRKYNGVYGQVNLRVGF